MYQPPPLVSAPSELQASWQNTFGNAKRVGAGLTPLKKALLDPTGRNSLADRVQSRPLPQQAGWFHWSETAPQVSWTRAIKGFKVSNEYLELESEANW